MADEDKPEDTGSLDYWTGAGLAAKDRGDKVAEAEAYATRDALARERYEPGPSEVSTNAEYRDDLIAEGGDNARIAKEWGRDSDHILSKARAVALAHPDIVRDAEAIPDDEAADYIERIADAGDGLGIKTINEQISEIQNRFPVGTPGNTAPLIQRRLRRLFSMQYGDGPICGQKGRLV